MEISIEIDLDETDEYFNMEARKMLFVAAQKFARGDAYDGMSLLDGNGNTRGRVRFHSAARKIARAMGRQEDWSPDTLDEIADILEAHDYTEGSSFYFKAKGDV